jgi:hypothetical protein
MSACENSLCWRLRRFAEDSLDSVYFFGEIAYAAAAKGVTLIWLFAHDQDCRDARVNVLAPVTDKQCALRTNFVIAIGDYRRIFDQCGPHSIAFGINVGLHKLTQPLNTLRVWCCFS